MLESREKGRFKSFRKYLDKYLGELMFLWPQAFAGSCPSTTAAWARSTPRRKHSIPRSLFAHLSSEVNAKLKSIVPGPNLFKDIDRIFPHHVLLRPVVRRTRMGRKQPTLRRFAPPFATSSPTSTKPVKLHTFFRALRKLTSLIFIMFTLTLEC